ncbi:MAG: 4-(cytidine 5'-diphospho)-2-C-methyl-D-erythritol kinase [Candidatus Omnitrophica bacterium]|nr:4-(cytidine 5'-diphospho)-2-C-methyl-D-erythritol kinase [Candidatus Omnitrophota bacterium]
MRPFTLKSPAKLNLYLSVNHRRPDGYHDITTLFERINLFDEISFESAVDQSIRISCDHPQVPVGRKNLVYQAAKLLQDEFGLRQGARIYIRKRIPVAAGLAGGSSNCATALLGLNRLWGLKLGREELVRFGQSLGCDVAFFLYDTSWAWGRGRGDQIEPLDVKTKCWHIVVTPKAKVYSSAVYSALKLELTKKIEDVNILLSYLRMNNIIGLGRVLHNDLEPAVCSFCSTVESVKAALKKWDVPGARVSGSGPSVYALTENAAQARNIAEHLAHRYAQVFVVSTF